MCPRCSNSPDIDCMERTASGIENVENETISSIENNQSNTSQKLTGNCTNDDDTDDTLIAKDPGELDVSDGLVTEKPKNKHYATIHFRLLTYTEKCPKEKRPRAEQLAKAGFFYVGHGDGVKCFFCSIGLGHWENDDVPWLEHARFSPRCGYVRQSRGVWFINTIQRLQKENQANLNNPEVRSLLHDVLPKENWDEDGKFITPATQSARNMRYPLPAVTQTISQMPPMEATKDSSTSSEDSSILVCKICLVNDSTIMYVPCGHLVACAECAFAMESCPICRVPYTGTLRVQMK